MGRMQDFDEALRVAGIPIDGVSGTGANARIDFAASATPAQRAAANALRGTFDWVEKPDPTVPGVLAAIAAMTPARRQTLYSATVAELIVRFGLKVDLTPG